MMIFQDWRSVVEIIILFLLIYAVLYSLRKTHVTFILMGLIALAVIWALAQIFGLVILVSLMERFFGSLLVILLIIFQPELRKLLFYLGNWKWWMRHRQAVSNELVTAVHNMARRKCGALIVIERKNKLQNLIDDAIVLDARVNASLIESIFYPNSPLHDGAVIIRDDHVVAARVILPLTKSKEVPSQLGTRHRAALGISEECDAVTIVVSEESGDVTLAYSGDLHRDLTISELAKMLDTLLVHQDSGELSEVVMQLNNDENRQNPDENVENGAAN